MSSCLVDGWLFVYLVIGGSVRFSLWLWVLDDLNWFNCLLADDCSDCTGNGFGDYTYVESFHKKNREICCVSFLCPCVH